MSRFNSIWKMRALGILLVGGLLVSLARAETVEMVTHFPARSVQPNLSLDSLVVGDDLHRQLSLGDGVLWVDKALGIRVADPSSGPIATLDVQGSFFLSGGNGDVDGDGAISPTDVNLISAHLSLTGLLPPAFYARADVDGDGMVTALDQQLVTILMGVSPVPDDSAVRMEFKTARGRGIDVDLNRNVQVGGFISKGATLTTPLTVAPDTAWAPVSTMGAFDFQDNTPQAGDSFSLVFKHQNDNDELPIMGRIRTTPTVVASGGGGNQSGDLSFELADGTGAVSEALRLTGSNSSVGLGVQLPELPTYAGGKLSGNLDVNDLFIRALPPNGVWVSQMTLSGPAPFGRDWAYTYQGRNWFPSLRGTFAFIIGTATISGSPTQISWNKTPFEYVYAVFLNPRSLDSNPTMPVNGLNTRVISLSLDNFVAETEGGSGLFDYVVIGEQPRR